MARTRKRARRAPPTRRRRHTRHRGGEKLGPMELIEQFRNLSVELKEARNRDNVFNNDELFKKVKVLYNDNIPMMKHSDWINLLQNTPTRIDLKTNAGKEEILTRLNNIASVFEFWLQIRKQKKNTAHSGFFRRLISEDKQHSKLWDARKHVMVFLQAVRDIVLVMSPPSDQQSYVSVVTPLIESLQASGENVSVFRGKPFYYQS